MFEVGFNRHIDHLRALAEDYETRLFSFLLRLAICQCYLLFSRFAFFHLDIILLEKESEPEKVVCHCSRIGVACDSDRITQEMEGRDRRGL